MEINLLPKIPNTRRFRFPISFIIAIVVLVPSGFIGWQAWGNSIILEEQQSILQDLVNKSDYYSGKLEENKTDTQLFEKYFTELNLIRDQHLDWVVLFDGLTSKLPTDAIITSLTYDGGESVLIDAEFPSINLGAQYIQWLETIDWVDEIKSAQSETQTGNYLLEIELKIEPQTLLKGGEVNE